MSEMRLLHIFSFLVKKGSLTAQPLRGKNHPDAHTSASESFVRFFANRLTVVLTFPIQATKAVDRRQYKGRTTLAQGGERMKATTRRGLFKALPYQALVLPVAYFTASERRRLPRH